MLIDDPDDPVAMYLREVANVVPLTKSEEAALFEELGRADNRKAERSLAPTVVIDPAGARGECLPFRELAARRLIESHLKAVADIAKKYSSSGVPMLELLEEGNLGLMKAVDRFAEQPAGEFREFAATCIEDAIRARVGESE